jgi:protoporphyrinogen/coproporphyrinogen III oxidase
MAMSYDCIIVGGGISGLGAAYGLLRRDAALLLIEAAPEVGGAMQSERTPEGFLIEHGPNTVVGNDPALWAAFDKLGIGAERIVAGAQGKTRYLLHHGNAEPLPLSPPALLTTPLLSPLAKLRALAEPLIPRTSAADESAYAFVARRVGRDAAERFLDPFVSGVYAGDPRQLSMRASFPSLWASEQRAGSLLLGMASGRRRGPQPLGKRELFSFEQGLRRWPEAVARALGPRRLWTNSRVTAIAPTADGWQLTVVRAHGETVALHASEVILAAPAYVSAELVAPLDGDAARALGGIPYPPLAVVHLGYFREDVSHPLDGFGMLCPASEGRAVLGSLWPSTLFAGRAPQGAVLTSQFVGGMRAPELALDDDATLIARTHRELVDLIGVSGKPRMARVVRWPRAIPQYLAGHEARMAALARLEAARPGLHLLGNFRGGVSAVQCWQNGVALAARVRLPRAVESASAPEALNR